MRPAALLVFACFALGCTTSFDVSSLRARDAGDAEISTDTGLDAPGLDASSCGEEGLRCCETAATPCAAGTVCNEGRCQRCPGATTACGGVCVDLQANLNHCGACGRACDPGLSCRAGTCVLACPDPLTACGGACVDVTRNPMHCGACGNACPGGQVCAGGSCGLVCGARETPCAGSCVDTTSSPAHCGACGRACSVPNAAPSCVDGRCGLLACNAGFADCNGNPADGCETPLTSLAHCGACGNACALPHATARCASAACAVEMCEAGWADCDGVASNGCEVSTLVSTAHCGRCNNACPAPTGTRATCVAGVCGTTTQTCMSGRADCDGAVGNGCETDITTVANCGACGIACVLPRATPTCAGGACAVNRCDAGFADCDRTASNGCEVDTRASAANCGGCGRACNLPNATAACANSACAIGACNTGYADCNGNPADGCEVDVRAAAANCGRCGNACATANGTPACVQGQCVIASCRQGYASCDGNAANGCETRTSEDVANCGLCGNACVRPNAMTRCEMGACGVTSCATGYADCNGNPADGCETNVNTSTQHCGACGRGCAVANGVGVCAMGACAVASCAMGYANCDGRVDNGCEVNTLADARHCGACGRACGSNQVCAGGVCVDGCAPPRTTCGNACVDLQTDVRHCGACGRACPAGVNGATACVSGTCVLQCAAGFGDCDGSASNGCEVNLGASPTNCGRCGVACPGGANAQAVCASGSCALSCNLGWGDCDPTQPGCETDLRVTANSCGACGRRCPRPPNALETCTAGACGFRCNAGWGDCDGDARNGCETNLFASASSCGRCGAQCIGALDIACRGGVCSLCRNDANFATCGLSSMTPCSINLDTNPAHCGACGQQCPSNGTRRDHATYTGACDAGHCRASCDAGWGDCDNNWQNGCETNTTCDSAHCGACGNACADGTVCCEGRCVSATTADRCLLNAPGCR